MIVLLEVLIGLVTTVGEGLFFLGRWSDTARRSSLLLDQSPLERRARRRRVGMGCAVILFMLLIALAILAIAT